MPTSKLNLPALLVARLCHDLISPVGAISNGLELLSLTGDANGPEFDLIGESVANANAKLALFRLAFGSGGTQTISTDALNEMLAGLYGDSGFTAAFETTGELSKSDAKLLLLLTLCCETAMNRRGKVTLTKELTVRCQGDVRPNKNALFTRLRNGLDWPEDIGAADVHFPLTELALSEASLQLQCALDGQTFNIWTKAHVSELLINREPSRHLRQGT